MKFKKWPDINNKSRNSVNDKQNNHMCGFVPAFDHEEAYFGVFNIFLICILAAYPRQN